MHIRSAIKQQNLQSQNFALRYFQVISPASVGPGIYPFRITESSPDFLFYGWFHGFQVTSQVPSTQSGDFFRRGDVSFEITATTSPSSL